ncbi:MAG: hypothetical protein V4621_05490 [Pseudomonadota bacterium]
MFKRLKSGFVNAINSTVNALQREAGYWMDDLNLRGGAVERIVDTILPHVDAFTVALRQSGATRPTMAVQMAPPANNHTYQYAIRCPGGVRQAQDMLQRDGIGALSGINIQHAQGDHYVVSVNRAARPVSETGDGEACYHTAKETIAYLDAIGAQRVQYVHPQVMPAENPARPVTTNTPPSTVTAFRLPARPEPGIKQADESRGYAQAAGHDVVGVDGGFIRLPSPGGSK